MPASCHSLDLAADVELTPADHCFARFTERHPPRLFETSVKLTARARHYRRINAWYPGPSRSFVGAALSMFDEVDRMWIRGCALTRLRSILDRLPVEAAKYAVVGTDFRDRPADSRLKIAFSFVGVPRATELALALHPGPAMLRAAVRPDRLLFGFAICGRGNIHVKLYPSFHLDGDDAERFDAFAGAFLGEPAVALARHCSRVHVTWGPAHEGLTPVLHFRPRRFDDFVHRLPPHELPLSNELARARAANLQPKVISARASDLARDTLLESNIYCFVQNKTPHN